jgi:hypothetical protein
MEEHSPERAFRVSTSREISRDPTVRTENVPFRECTWGICKDTPMPKIADRPHWVTIALALLGSGIAAFGLWWKSRPAEHPRPVASREFIVGVWQADRRDVNGNHWVNKRQYLASGRYEGWDIFVDKASGAAKEIRASGTWEFEKLSDQTFQISGTPDRTPPWQAELKIIDEDHIQNIRQTYIVERLAK